MPIASVTLQTREDVMVWMIATQLGRRNLTPEQKSYLRGKRYNLEKRPDEGHGDQKSGDQNDLPTTAQRLGEEYGVGEATIKRDAAFADAVDTLEDQVRADIRETVLTRQRNGTGATTKKQTVAAAKAVKART
jgi:hypothetical protein